MMCGRQTHALKFNAPVTGPANKEGDSMYEHSSTPPRTMGRFLERMAIHGCVALSLIAVSLFAGMLGYRHFERMPWRDAFLNASMILGGMGPVKTDLSEAGKLFAGLYALYSGLVLVGVMGLMLTPVVHRVMHKLNWDDGEGGDDGRRHRFRHRRGNHGNRRL